MSRVVKYLRAASPRANQNRSRRPSSSCCRRRRTRPRSGRGDGGRRRPRRAADAAPATWARVSWSVPGSARTGARATAVAARRPPCDRIAPFGGGDSTLAGRDGPFRGVGRSAVADRDRREATSSGSAAARRRTARSRPAGETPAGQDRQTLGRAARRDGATAIEVGRRHRLARRRAPGTSAPCRRRRPGRRGAGPPSARGPAPGGPERAGVAPGVRAGGGGRRRRWTPSSGGRGRHRPERRRRRRRPGRPGSRARSPAPARVAMSASSSTGSRRRRPRPPAGTSSWSAASPSDWSAAQPPGRPAGRRPRW